MYRRDGRIEHVCDLARTEAEDVAKHDDRDLATRQDLKGGDERQGDRLVSLVAGLGAERQIAGVVKEGVGKGLEPYDLAEPRRLGWFDIGHVPPPRSVSAG